MASSPEFVQELIDRLEPLGALRSKRMFGEVGVYADERFFCIIADDRVFFKVDDTTRPAYEEAGTGPFEPRGRPIGYYQVPDEVLEDPERFLRWAGRSVDVARRAHKR